MFACFTFVSSVVNMIYSKQLVLLYGCHYAKCHYVECRGASFVGHSETLHYNGLTYDNREKMY